MTTDPTARPASTPAPVAVPDVIANAIMASGTVRVQVVNVGTMTGFMRRESAEFLGHRIADALAATQDAPRPEPVAPLPSEASVFPTEAPPAQREQIARLVAAMQLGTEVPPSFVDYATAEAILDAGYRLVPEDDEDTVRVHRAAGRHYAAFVGAEAEANRLRSLIERLRTYVENAATNDEEHEAVADFLDAALDGAR